MDELEQSGAFDNALSDKDQLDRELEEVTTDSEVDAELETLKAEMGTETEADAADESADAEAGDAEASGESADVEMEMDMDVEPAESVDDAAVESELEELKEEESTSN